MTTKTALVTGASSGIGEAIARRLQRLGCTVYGAARRTDRLAVLAADGVRTLSLDVTDDDSARRGVERILAETGRIDVLVNNAGYGSYGAIEDVPLEEARRQFEVNVFGAMRLAQLVLPGMRARGGGTIANISSMGGRIYTPLGGWYHGSKHALEALSDCLRLETRRFGVRVVLIEPGSIATEWGGIAADSLKATSASGAYAAPAGAVARTLRSGGPRSSPPTVVADAVGRAVTARRPRTRYVVGFGARPLLAAHALLPDRAFDRLIAIAVGGPRT